MQHAISKLSLGPRGDFARVLLFTSSNQKQALSMCYRKRWENLQFVYVSQVLHVRKMVEVVQCLDIFSQSKFHCCHLLLWYKLFSQ